MSGFAGALFAFQFFARARERGRKNFKACLPTALVGCLTTKYSSAGGGTEIDLVEFSKLSSK